MLLLTIISISWTDMKTTVIIFGVVFIFHMLTLSISYKASQIAKEQLVELNLITKKEIEDVEVILNDLITVNIASIIDNITNGIKSLIRNKDNQSR
jgi:Zn-dependent membrane protease YugP